MADTEVLQSGSDRAVNGLQPVAGSSNTPEDRPVFSAQLFPHRSLGRKGFRVMLGLAAFGFLPNVVYFAAKGAWPIALFCGLTFIGLYGAFRLSYRSAQVREHVWVSRMQVRVLKVSPSGRIREAVFNPFWTRFIVDEHSELGITGMRLASGGELVEIGTFLNPDDRESFAKALRAALARVKQRI